MTRRLALDAGIHPDDDDLDFSELWRVLKVADVSNVEIRCFQALE